MDTPEIVRGLKDLREDLTVQGISQNEHDALNAAIAKLSATCETCQHFRPDASWGCNHESGPVDVRPEDYCHRHTPRVPAREGGE